MKKAVKNAIKKRGFGSLLRTFLLLRYE
jgi:hypothetical protein